MLGSYNRWTAPFIGTHGFYLGESCLGGAGDERRWDCIRTKEGQEDAKFAVDSS